MNYEEIARFGVSAAAQAALDTAGNRSAKVLETTTNGLLKVAYRGAEIYVENTHEREFSADEHIILGVSDGQFYAVGPGAY